MNGETAKAIGVAVASGLLVFLLSRGARAALQARSDRMNAQTPLSEEPPRELPPEPQIQATYIPPDRPVITTPPSINVTPVNVVAPTTGGAPATSNRRTEAYGGGVRYGAPPKLRDDEGWS